MIRVEMDPGALAAVLNCTVDHIRADAMTIDAPFRVRRRGVELKLHLDVAPAEVDRTLVKNVARARRWLDRMLAGQTFSEIAG